MQTTRTRRLALSDEVLDELEERRLRPVHVVEDEDERLLARDRLAEAPKQPGDLGRRRRRLGIQRCEDGVAFLALRRVGENLAQRPVRDALAVGEAASPERRHALRAARELGHEARLPGTGRADDDLRAGGAAIDRALERPAQRGELPLPADERGVQPTLEGRPDGRELEEPVRVHGLALALDLERAARLEPRRVVDQPTGDLADDDLVVGGCLLELCRDPHRLAGDEPLARVGRRRDDLPRLQADPHLERHAEGRGEALVERGEPCVHVERGTRGAKRVVLVRDRDAEGGHDGVARVLLDGSSVPRDRRGHGLEVALEDASEGLGIERLRERHRLDDVAEQDRDEAPELHRRPCERHLLEQQRLVLAQDGRLQLLELGPRVEAQLVEQRLAGGAIRGERVGLAAGSVEGEHQLSARPLAERVRLDDRLELGDELRVAAEREVGLDPLLEHDGAQLLETGDLGLCERLVREVGERGAAPERERLAERRLGGLRAARLQRLPRLVREAT